MKSRANGFFTLFSERHLSMSSEFYSSEPSDCRGKRANPDYNSWPTHNLNDQGIKYDHSVASTKVMAPGRQKAAGAVHSLEVDKAVELFAEDGMKGKEIFKSCIERHPSMLSSMILTYSSPSFTLHINCLIKLPLTFGSATAMAVRVTTGSAQQLGGSQPKDRTRSLSNSLTPLNPSAKFTALNHLIAGPIVPAPTATVCAMRTKMVDHL
uniref:Uncharacterized protein n=1 Tax=Salix viminalis TaxID=40686 RepID=A0A6N2KVZ5_SALVM